MLNCFFQCEVKAAKIMRCLPLFKYKWYVGFPQRFAKTQMFGIKAILCAAGQIEYRQLIFWYPACKLQRIQFGAPSEVRTENCPEVLEKTGSENRCEFFCAVFPQFL